MNWFVDIPLYVFSALGGVVSIVTIHRWLFPFKKIRWKTVEKGVLKLKNKLIRENFVPSLIVGIGRGGSVIGALLSGSLGNVPILVIDRVYNWKGNIREDGVFDAITVHSNLEKVLLVAGELHTGGTAKKYIDHFSAIGAKEIRFMTFVKDPFPAMQPDFYYLEINKPDIKLPWMLEDEYRRESLEKC